MIACGLEEDTFMCDRPLISRPAIVEHDTSHVFCAAGLKLLGRHAGLFRQKLLAEARALMVTLRFYRYDPPLNACPRAL
jgi:hypothetical protein